jgi:indolepyruvate ferredoxin oxidoreductase beta subunit
MNSERPLTILIAALGGEGGGVMADWLMDAAAQCDFPAQSTSIPGVAQRTGATTYYLEIYPVQRAVLGGRVPVMALAPVPGQVDVLVASELVEAGRAMQNGYVTPDRTTLVASTHRVYATVEKVHAVDGRFDSARVLDAGGKMARRAVMFDMQRVAGESGTVINAVLFGALAGSGALPLPRAACEQAILRAGKGTEASLSGFIAAFEMAEKGKEATLDSPVHGQEEPSAALKSSLASFSSRIEAQFPPEMHEVLRLGVERLVDYQDADYATLYLNRARSVFEADEEPHHLAIETVRHLALWMSYEDVIRVADLKTRPSRFERVRREARAKPGEPVVVVDYLKPGFEEFASILPAWLGWRVSGWVERTGRSRAGLGLHIRTSSVHGWLLMKVLARLKRWRPKTWRFREEQRAIERWLRAIRANVRRDAGLALEIAECAQLVKGYGDTHRRGKANFTEILETLVNNPATQDPREQAAAIRAAREACLADPEKLLNATADERRSTPMAVNS